jgi:hypothetical protein
MAKLTLRTPWTRQPQRPVEIDQKWLSLGLVTLLDANGRNLVRGGISGVDVGSFSPRATNKGIGQSNGGAAYKTISGNFGDLIAPTNTSFTVVGVFAPNATGLTNTYLAQHSSGGSSQAAIIYGYTANSIEFYAPSFTGSDPRTGSSLVVSDTSAHAFCYSYDGVTWSGSLDGNTVFSTARTFNLNALRTSATMYAANGGAGLTNSSILLWAVFKNGIPLALQRSLTANPWQLFSPLSRTIWAPAAAGGGSSTLLPSGIPSDEAFGSHLISMGLVGLSPTSIASAEAFGSHTLSSIVALAPAGIASAEAFGTHVITVGNVTISPSGISSGEVFGSHIISQAGGSQTVLVNGIPSDEAFGTALINAGTIIVTPTGIASQEGFGTASFLTGTVVIFPSGIPSGEVFGIPALVGGEPSTATTVFYVRGFSSYGQRRNS